MLVRIPDPIIAVVAISNFLFRHLTFLLLFPFYNPDTINLHVLMVLSIGGIISAMFLPVVVIFGFTPNCLIWEKWGLLPECIL
jgi:hypothetical protein